MPCLFFKHFTHQFLFQAFDRLLEEDFSYVPTRCFPSSHLLSNLKKPDKVAL